MKEKRKISLEKTVRIITLAPVSALVCLIMMACFRWELLGSSGNFFLSVLFLTVLPVLAYPLQPLIPRFRNEGREGQRNLAMLLAVLGYTSGTAVSFLLDFPSGLKVFFLTYLFSGFFVALFNRFFHIRASGHACGVAGPAAYMLYFLGLPGLVGIPFLAAVFWASIRMKRHTFVQLVVGSIIPLVALGLSLLIIPA